MREVYPEDQLKTEIRRQPSKKLKPYWAELGYELRRDGLFQREFIKADGTPGFEVLVDAETFHRLRRENLTRLLLNKEHDRG